MKTLTLPYHRARRIAKAILPHVSKDDVTPVLTVASVTDDGYLVGTDRYTVGRITLDRTLDEKGTRGEREVLATVVDEKPNDIGFFIPRAALSVMASFGVAEAGRGAKHVLPSYMVRVQQHATEHVTTETTNRTTKRTVTLELLDTVGETVYLRRFEGVVGNYPPISRLIDGWLPADEKPEPFGISPTGIAKFAAAVEHLSMPYSLEYGKAQAGHTSNTSPLRVKAGLDFVGLIQPSLLLR